MKPSKTIMYVLDSLSKHGGVERVLTDKMNYLANHGFRVVVVTFQQGNHPIIFQLSPSIKHIDTGTRFFTVYKYNRFRRIFELWKLKKKYREQMQNIVDAEDPDFIIITSYNLPTCGIVSQLDTKAKLIVEAHTPKSMTVEGNIHSKNPIRRYIDRLNNNYQCQKAKHFDYLIALTSGSAKEWGKIVKKCIIIPNPVTQFPEIIPEKKLSNKRIITVGRLHPQKGYDRLITAFSLVANKCPEWHIDIYGDGDEKQMLSNLINQYKMQERIFLHPATPTIYEQYLSSDFFVMSSRFEGLPLVLIEAMSCGLPCVSYRCKFGPEDIIDDEETGLLVKDGDLHDLAEKILWMCMHDNQRIKMGEKARKSAIRYQKEHIMPLWINLFNNLQ